MSCKYAKYYDVDENRYECEVTGEPCVFLSPNEEACIRQGYLDITVAEEEVKENNSLDFLHFKLPSDSTLMRMKKEELISYIHMLHHNWDACDETCVNIQKYAKQLSKQIEGGK